MTAHLLIGLPARGGTVYCLVLGWVCATRDRTVHAVAASHAMDWAHGRSRRKTWDTVCGVRSTPWLAQVRDEDARATVAWPPRASGLAEVGWSRCVECHRLTGRLRPRTEVGRVTEEAVRMSRIVFLDTETTGLDPEREQVFEIAAIEQDGTEHVFRLEPLGIVVAHMHPKAAEVNRYHERTSAEDWEWDDLADVLDALTELLDGAHICGAVPDFDARFLTAMYRDKNWPPPVWHYHLIDIEAMAVGFLYGEASAWREVVDDGHIPDLVATSDAIPHPVTEALPWRSDDLSRACGVDPPSDDERHTALGDARWVRRLYEAITGGAS